MSKNTERDSLIQKKLEELTKKKEELTKELEENSKNYETNLQFVKDDKVISLRIITDLNKLVDDLFPYLIRIKKSIVQSRIVLLGKSDGDIIINGYSFDAWKNDFIKLVNKIKISNELQKINTALSQLPQFYTDEKKDDDNFNQLLASLD